MATHHLAIAKATFAASLLRPDPALSPLPKDRVSEFHAFIDAAIAQCSPANVQACREWICSNIAPSRNRTVALGKFLNALVQSYKSSNEDGLIRTNKLSPQRKQLHVLYVLNDVLHWTRYHGELVVAEAFALDVHSALVDIVALIESSDAKTRAIQTSRIPTLLDVWAKKRYFSTEAIEKLWQAAENRNSADASVDASATQTETELKEAPWFMPGFHGDPSTPYYDLPAGNFLPHIIEGSRRPIRTSSVQALRFATGPADEKLVLVVKQFLKAVDSVEDTMKDVVDIDEMGQHIVLDETGKQGVKDTYYGWSQDFCERMKEKIKKSHGTDRNGSRSSSRNRSRSISRDSMYRDYSSRRTRSVSRSRSRSHSSRKRRRSRSRSHSSRDHRRRRSYSRSQSPARSRSRERPRNAFPSTAHPTGLAHPLPPVPPITPFLQLSGTPGAGNVPVPPRPAGWQGPWPPPPPGMMMGGQFTASVPPPPPGFLPGIQVPFPFPPLAPGQGGRGNSNGHAGRGRGW